MFDTTIIPRRFENILKSKFLRHISTVFLWDNFAKLSAVATTVILIRVLPKEEYALYTFFGAAAIFFTQFVSNGIDMAYVRFAAEEYSVRKRVPNDIFVFSAGLCLLVFLLFSPLVISFSEQLSQLMFKSRFFSKPLLFGFVAAFGSFLIAMISRYYQVQEKYKNAGFILSLHKTLFLLALLAILALTGLTFERVVAAQIAVIAVMSALLVHRIFRTDLFRERIALKVDRFKTFLQASFWLILYYVCTSLFVQLDIFMISRMLTSDDLANYGVASKYYIFLMFAYPSIKTVLKVRTSKIDMVESFERQKHFLKKWLQTSTLIFAPIIGIVIVGADYFMVLLNGSKYTEAIMPFKILALCAISNYVFSAAGDVFRAMKKYFLLFCFGFVALLINFAVNLWLIPIHGISGAAAATLISYFLVDGGATLYILTIKSKG